MRRRWDRPRVASFRVPLVPARAAFLAACWAAAALADQGGLPFADARAAALGYGAALDAGAFALGANPAALVTLPSLSFAFNHKIYPVAATSGEAGVMGVPLGTYGAMGGGFNTVRFGGVDQYDAFGRYLGTYTYHDDRIAGGYAFAPTRWLGLGAALNYDRHLPAPNRAYHTLGLDAGALARPFGANPGLDYTVGTIALGLGARNLVSSARETYTGEHREPPTVTAGASWSRDLGPHRLMLNLDAPLKGETDVALGAEFVVHSVFAVRASVAGAKPAAGVGVSTDLLSFDYCYQMRDADAYHYVSLSVNPGRDVHARSLRHRLFERWLDEGRAYYETGKYDLAAERFANVLREDPYNAVARSYWTRAKYNQYLAEGKEYIKAQDWERARRSFGAALIVAPNDFLAQEYLAHVDQLEAAEETRRVEEERVASLLAQAEDALRRGAYKKAISLCEDILAIRPGHGAATDLLVDARRLYAASTAKPPEVTPAPVPPEAVAEYQRGAELLKKGALNEAVGVLGGVVAAYPDYGAARAKLVEAYLYQGLDFYSKGSLSAALRAWRGGLALDPGNEKLKRYITKAEAEMDQIR